MEEILLDLIHHSTLRGVPFHHRVKAAALGETPLHQMILMMMMTAMMTPPDGGKIGAVQRKAEDGVHRLRRVLRAPLSTGGIIENLMRLQ